ncbi:MAG: DUF2141 domain-containing protein [Flavobacteriaceae bacterium]|nr:DUF2141 domain-containing protein [Flavobacteriaceae bacterium]
MKTLTMLIAMLTLSLTAFAQEGQNIEVTIDNVVNDQGKVVIALHTTDTFMKGPGIMNLESKIVDGKVAFTFENVAPGTYAIIALHDANENNRMDFDSGGMPKESYGMSGNDMSMGPPNFEAAKFVVGNEDVSFSIRF